MTMSATKPPVDIFSAPKIDCHCHVLDPVHFPYGDDTFYRPSGQETGTARQLVQMHDAYGIRHGLIVGPNSGYENDSRCLLDALERGEGRYKGIAVVPNDATREVLVALRAQGVVGVAFNATHHGVERYLGAGHEATSRHPGQHRHESLGHPGKTGQAHQLCALGGAIQVPLASSIGVRAVYISIQAGA